MPRPPKPDPHWIFNSAEQFRHSAKLLNTQNLADQMMLWAPFVVCYAFSLELYFKCQISIETGDWPPNEHDLKKLFLALAPATQARVKAHYENHRAAKAARVAKAKHKKKGSSDPDFDTALAESSDAFRAARYVHESTSTTKFGWFGTPIVEGVRELILEAHPAWKMKLIREVIRDGLAQSRAKRGP